MKGFPKPNAEKRGPKWIRGSGGGKYGGEGFPSKAGRNFMEKAIKIGRGRNRENLRWRKGFLQKRGGSSRAGRGRNNLECTKNRKGEVGGGKYGGEGFPSKAGRNFIEKAIKIGRGRNRENLRWRKGFLQKRG